MSHALGRPEAWTVERSDGPKEASKLALYVGLAKSALVGRTGWVRRRPSRRLPSGIAAGWRART